jgi:hypothetical protein
MTDSYVQTPEARINDLVKDLVVAGHLARARKLQVDYAEKLAARFKVAATDMILDGDRELLSAAASTLKRASIRIKSAEVRPRVKAASRPEPDIAAMSRAADFEQVFRGSPFSVNDHERQEAERAAEANRQLAAKQRRHEAQRAAQVAAAAEPKGPGR